jgi:hypothetical protein
MQKDRILEAIATGEILKVRYFGGSTPGVDREIHPMSMSGEKVMARCLESDELKTFLLEKLEETDGNTPSVMAAKFPSPPTTFPTLREFTDFHLTFLKGLGWIVRLEASGLNLHRTYGGGKVYVGPEVSLTFNPNCPDYSAVSTEFSMEAFEAFVDQVNAAVDRSRSTATGKELVGSPLQKPNPKPWKVSSPSSGRTFAKFDKAQHYFLEVANSRAPGPGVP